MSTRQHRMGPSLCAEAFEQVAVNTDPARFPTLLAGLPPAMLADLDALSLHNKDLGRLKARLLLVHGRNDNLIPYPENGSALAGSRSVLTTSVAPRMSNPVPIGT